MKTALLLGLLTIGIPSEVEAEPQGDETTEEARSSSTFSMTTSGNPSPNHETIQQLYTVVQSHLPTIDDLQKQYLKDATFTTMSLQIGISNGVVSTAEVYGEPKNDSSNGDLDSFAKAVVKYSKNWVFSEEISQQVIINFSIGTNPLTNSSGIGPSKPDSDGSSALYGVPDYGGGTGELGGLGGLKPHYSVQPKYGAAPVEILAQRSKTRLGVVTIKPLDGIDKEASFQTAVNKTFRRYLGQVKQCHTNEMQISGEINGELFLALTVTDGRVMAVSVQSNSTGSERLASCVERRIKRWKFPTSTATEIEVKYVLSVK